MGILINPYCAVVVSDYIFKSPGTPPLAKEDWVLANSKLIGDIGASKWLEELLSILTKKPTDKSHAYINPGEAVVLSERLRGKHEPLVDTDVWIAGNIKVMDKLGIGEWLWQLLDVLETGGPEPA